MESEAVHLCIAGFQGSEPFARVVNVFRALETLHPNRIAAKVDEYASEEEFDKARATKSKELGVLHTTSPMVWFEDGQYLGGADDAVTWAKVNFTSPKSVIRRTRHRNDRFAEGEFEYDLVVLGGGSGGLACSKEAADLGAKVAVLDYVKPSPLGTSWGLGGTCVNVGCIPKKMMHTAALHGESFSDARAFGWEVPETKHDWSAMVDAVQDHIQGLNFSYRVALRDKRITYINALGAFVDPHTIECVDKAGKRTQITARRTIVAVGGRPTPLACPGGELAMSSDDLFSLEKPPGRTLVIGASYVALECAGFLRALGYPVTVLVRSILLRGFDRDMAERIGEHMEGVGTNILRGMVPKQLVKTEAGTIRVQWCRSKDESGAVVGEGEFDSVFCAIGRRADTSTLGLDAAGVAVAANGKIKCVDEQTSVPHIYAIGDVVDGCPELTPVAIQAGRLLARRLYRGDRQAMNYDMVPTTVFTPLEYGACGLAEEEAEARLGKANVEVYHSSFTPLEWAPSDEREPDVCYCKLITNKLDDERVVGLHILGPHAGEMTQGFAAAMRLGATYADFCDTVGIHPTVAEEFTTLAITKSSGESANKGGC